LARIPYEDTGKTELTGVTARIRQERGSILHLYAMLLHSPPITEGWLHFLTAIRQECTLEGTIRELIIIQIAILNGARYEADQHIPIALREGISQAQIDALLNWRNSTLFDERTRAVLAYCEAITVTIVVDQEIFSAVRSHFDDLRLVELTATIAAYNMVSRFVLALDIKSDD
jgi:alkylhydroperoxidase family enzyme